MKIGTIYTLYGRRAGAELYFEKMLTGLLSKYSDLSFIVYCNSEAYHILPSENERLEKVKINYLNNQFTKAYWLEILSASRINKDNLDLFWIPSGTNNFPGNWKIPTIVTFLDFGEYHVKKKYDLKRTAYRKLICIPKSINRGTRFTSISQSTASDLYNLFKKTSTVIYPGPSPHEFSFELVDPIAAIKQETSIEFNKIIFTPGRIDYTGKGLDVILKAYKKFCESFRDPPKLVFVGPPGENHEKLLLEIKSLDLSGKALWLGRVSDLCINALYKVSEMVVIPSRYEGFGFPVLEALQFKAPLICSDAGSLPEIAGEGAVIFKAGDVDDLWQAMLKVYSDENLRKKLISLGQNRLKQFSWDKAYIEMHKIIDETYMK